MQFLNSALKRQPRLIRFLSHIHQRIRLGRLNLVTGAGISLDAGVPSWQGLLDLLAAKSDGLPEALVAHRKAGLTPEYLGQIIYHRHKNLKSTGGEKNLEEATVNHCWAQAIRDAIYKKVPAKIDDVVSNHPYLGSLRNLAWKVPLVINFNFDDILAQSMSCGLNVDDQKRSFSVDWRPPLVDRVNHTTIYHVNGLLPQISLKKRSPRLTFTEDSFADALARSPGVSAEYMFMRFVQNTMLIVGHSLGDASLKNYLRLNRDKCPANHHYMVYWISDVSAMTAEQQADIFDANLELYNVITMFFISEEIKEFFDLLNMDERSFGDRLGQMEGENRSTYHYYIVGPVAAGKSSLLEHLRCFQTYEEWTRPPPPEMNLSFDKLTPEQSEVVDSFVYNELREKNSRMIAAGTGFHFMDRAPLDLYAFSASEEENKRKTAIIKARVTKSKPFQDGQIIFLKASGSTLVKRNYGRGRDPADAGNSKYLDMQTATLEGIYNPQRVFSTDDLPSDQIAKTIVRHVLLGEYIPTDLNELMERIN